MLELFFINQNRGNNAIVFKTDSPENVERIENLVVMVAEKHKIINKSRVGYWEIGRWGKRESGRRERKTGEPDDLERGGGPKSFYNPRY